ncbi:uncharacterized protein EI90DRAFT_3041903, partial [Cantharellus anzutake]|uniref:uncharacterized protein n=1 Tax=Cantharellus anzutake TaxID=1750568 RepID=UPI0019060157
MYLPKFKSSEGGGCGSFGCVRSGRSAPAFVEESLAPRGQAEMSAQPTNSNPYIAQTGIIVIGVTCGLLALIVTVTTVILRTRERRKQAKEKSLVNQPAGVTYKKETQICTDSMQLVELTHRVVLPRHPQASYSVSSFGSSKSRGSLEGSKYVDPLAPTHITPGAESPTSLQDRELDQDSAERGIISAGVTLPPSPKSHH